MHGADRLQAREEETNQQIAVLTAELKKSQWEKGLVEQRAQTLSTALAYRATSPSKVCPPCLAATSTAW